MVRDALRAVIEALFRVLFTYDCVGEDKIPPGPAVVAANHPSYLDPVLLSLQVRRPIRFMAWDALFRVPVLGSLVRLLGAFPVDVRKGQGGSAYSAAKRLVEEGEVVGIFPEGKRSRTGWMEPALREGAARLALETGAPVVPASITGAYRAWPHDRTVPRPGRVRVRFHAPIDPRPYQSLPEEEGVRGLLEEVRRRVERSLLPGVKADLRLGVLYRLRPAWPRFFEVLLPLAAATLVFWKSRSLTAVVPAYGYLAYLFLDRLAIPQSRVTKWLRGVSPALFVLGYGRVVLEALGGPDVPAPEALAAICLGGLFAYVYERSRVALPAVRGFVTVAALETAAQMIAPDPFGPHVALPLFLAIFAWERRSVFWRWAAPVLAGYALAVPLLLAHGAFNPVHALPALLAWLAERVFPYDLGSRNAEATAAPVGLGLRL